MHAQESYACTRFLCMRQEVSKTTIISVLLRLLPRNVYKNCVFFTKETTADHHQVPRMSIKRVPGTIKTETGTGRENGP